MFVQRHYEAKLCIPCIVSAFSNRSRSNLLRNTQLYYFFDLLRCLDSTNKNLKLSTAQNHRSKNRRTCGIRNRIAESRTFYGIHKQIMRHYGAKLGIPCIVSGFRNRPRSNLSRNPQLYYFFDLLRCLDSTNKNLKHSTAQNHRTKNRRNCGIRNRIC